MFKDLDSAQNALEYEILQEKAATLARLSAKLEAALSALESVDKDLATASAPSPDLLAQRSNLVQEAAELLWYVIVQREVMGMTTHDWLFRTYHIPDEVRGRMGPRRRT
jgi:hypothetical protein